MGPDGISAQMLRALQPGHVAKIAQAFREWENQGSMPETVTTSLVALLPKKATEETTSYAYRAWCRTRYPLHDAWLETYRSQAPWTGPYTGLACLLRKLHAILWPAVRLSPRPAG